MAPTNVPAKTITIHIGPSLSDPSVLTEFREMAAKDASNWNSLLRWHRRNRGPQWDYSTAMYQVDQGCREYYGGVNRKEDQEPVEEEIIQPSPERPGSTQNAPQTKVSTEAMRASQPPGSEPSSTPLAGSSILPPMSKPLSQSSGSLTGLPPMPAPLSQQSQQNQFQQLQPHASPHLRAQQLQQQHQQQQGNLYLPPHLLHMQNQPQSISPGLLEKSP